MNTIQNIIKAFEDEKRLHKMISVSFDPQVYVRPLFDMGNMGDDLEELDKMCLTFFVAQKMYVVEVSRDVEGFEYGTLTEFSGSKGSWKFEQSVDLPDKVAETLCRTADGFVSLGSFIVREVEARDTYTDDGFDSDSYLDREYWDKERSEYRSRLADEAEYRDPRIYTSKYDSYFPAFA